MRTMKQELIVSAFTLVPCLLVAWGLILAACGSEGSNGQTVAVKLSLVFNSQQAQNQPKASRIIAFLQCCIPGTASAQAQSVTEIATIQVQIAGPGIPAPIFLTQAVSNPSSGDEIHFNDIQVPIGSNRTITVAALNGGGLKIFDGLLSNVTLAPGPPIPLVITLKRVFTVTVNKQGLGSGTVTSSPGGIDCGATCSAQFEEETSVALNAVGESGSAFVVWGGDCSGIGVCTVTDNATVTVRFDPSATNHLTVNINGTGTVTSNPNGIFCPPACESNFTLGTAVVLTGTPTGGATTPSWSGGGCGGVISTCIIVMSSDQTITATFTTPSTR